MKHVLLSVVLLSCLLSCKNAEVKTPEPQEEDNTSQETIDTSNETKDFREFKVLDSKYLKKDEIWSDISSELTGFTDTYHALKPLILEQDIPTLQQHIKEGKLTYELVTKFYLYRIKKFDRENPLSLNSVIAINPNVIEEARERDKQLDKNVPAMSIYGMPILLKDNINASGMPTTAGAVALKDNYTEDAFIVSQLKSHGAIILGKANLSEWAYFFCGDCPSGYSAIGGQTLNPYGRRQMDTGGSSSGSAVAVAANFCAAAIGSETSGSILSPSSQNSVVGLKPTIGLVSRSGIVPISSTLDTAGPMTKSVIDNAILMDVLFGEDTSDPKSIWALWDPGFYTKDIREASLDGKRFGAIKRLMTDSLYMNALSVLKERGAEIVEIDEEDLKRTHFLNLLNLDMKQDLPKYLETYANPDVKVTSVDDVIAFNKLDSVNVMPYGQRLFEGIVADTGSVDFLIKIKDSLYGNGKQFFDVPMKQYQLNAILSINNYHAGWAAVAEYPAITVPMGYTDNGVPKGLTFISTRLSEKQLLEYAYAYEQASSMRKPPQNYN